MPLKTFNKALGSTLKVCENGAASLERRKSTGSTRAIATVVKFAQSGHNQLEIYEAKRSGAQVEVRSVGSESPQYPQSPYSPLSPQSPQSPALPQAPTNPQAELVEAMRNCEALEAERERALARGDTAAVCAVDLKLAAELSRAAICADSAYYPPTEKKKAQDSQAQFREGAQKMRSGNEKQRSETVRNMRVAWKGIRACNSVVTAVGILGTASAITLVMLAPTTTVMAADGTMQTYGTVANDDGTTTYMLDTDGDMQYDHQAVMDDSTGQVVESMEPMSVFDNISNAFETVSSLFG